MVRIPEISPTRDEFFPLSPLRWLRKVFSQGLPLEVRILGASDASMAAADPPRKTGPRFKRLFALQTAQMRVCYP